MITINNKIYNNYKTFIKWGDFSAIVNGKKEHGIAPVIKFILEDSIMIELEFAFSKEKFQNLEKNQRVDFSRYLVGVAYEDDNGWLPIINESVIVYLTRINEYEFKIDLKIKCIELDDMFININRCIKIL